MCAHQMRHSRRGGHYFWKDTQELRNTTEMENSLEGFNAALSRQKKDVMNWKTGQSKVSSLRSRKKKRERKLDRATGVWDVIRQVTIRIMTVPAEKKEGQNYYLKK